MSNDENKERLWAAADLLEGAAIRAQGAITLAQRGKQAAISAYGSSSTAAIQEILYLVEDGGQQSREASSRYYRAAERLRQIADRLGS